MHKLLRNAIAVDTETLGLERGSGVHELSVFNLETNEAREFLLTPNFVALANATPQETTKLATNTADIAGLVRKNSWLDVIRATILKGKIADNATREQVLEALKTASPWLAKSLHKYPHLTNGVTDVNERMRTLGPFVSAFESSTVDPAELLKSGGELQKLISGKTLWFSNAAFDSKQVGALISGLANEGVVSDLKANMETAGPTADPFYVTGVEVNRARVLAQQTGDWTHVWKAYVAHTPANGETAVRDVQDVLKAMMSYGQKLGLAKEGDVYWGTGLDIAYKLMGSLEPGEAGKTKLLSHEVHRATEDNAIHLKYVLERALQWTDALDEVHSQTAAGKELIRQAGEKTGPLYEVAAFFKRQEALRPTILQNSAIKRLVRAKTDLLEQGHTYQTDGWAASLSLSQKTPSNDEVQVPFLKSNRVQLSSMDDVISHLNRQNKYAGDVDYASILTDINNNVNHTLPTVEQKAALASYLDEKTALTLEKQVSAQAENLVSMFNNNIGKSVTKAVREGDSIGRAANSLARIQAPARMKFWGMAAGAMAGAGLIWSMASGNAHPTREQPSLVTYNYQQWLQHQSQFFDSRPDSEQNQGMSERGVAGRLRKLNTDFGSPYAGVQGSQVVFMQQKLLQEREKWLREQYGATYYDPSTGLFGLDGVMSRAMHQGYSYLPGGKQVDPGYRGLKHKALMKINLGDGSWAASAEDADTIVVKRAGLRGAVASLFGLNKGYAFRLAGVDSPEVTHPGQLTGGQPSGEASLQGFAQMLNQGKNLELVYDPAQTTYGRTMGVVFADGRNLNYELVKRGFAAHLPFGKESDSIIDYQKMKSMETGAAAVSRGMWQHPYWKTLYDVTATSGQRPTFNTLTKADKLVESVSQMNTLALMEQAEQQGFYSTAMANEAAMAGKFTHRGVDSVKPVISGPTASHYAQYIQELNADTSTWMRNKGTRSASSLSARGGYGKLDQSLAIDSLSQTNSIWTHSPPEAVNTYGAKAALRRQRQVESQQAANQAIFQSQINHGVM